MFISCSYIIIFPEIYVFLGIILYIHTNCAIPIISRNARHYIRFRRSWPLVIALGVLRRWNNNRRFIQNGKQDLKKKLDRCIKIF